jgi:hypothetical protein
MWRTIGLFFLIVLYGVIARHHAETMGVSYWLGFLILLVIALITIVYSWLKSPRADH